MRCWDFIPIFEMCSSISNRVQNRNPATSASKNAHVSLQIFRKIVQERLYRCSVNSQVYTPTTSGPSKPLQASTIRGPILPRQDSVPKEWPESAQLPCLN